MTYPEDSPVPFAHFDFLGAVDFANDERKHATSCWKCRSPEPAILYAPGEHGDDGCSDCNPEPHCSACLRIFESYPGLGYVLVDWPPMAAGCNCGRIHERRVCDDCWERVK